MEKRNIFLIGPMGSGKSSVGRQLSKKLNMDFYDSDQEIERRTGADISWIFDLEGEEGFRKREEKIISELTEKKRIVLATGGGSIISNVIRNQLSSRGIVIYLSTGIEKQFLRTQRDRKRPLLYKNLEPRLILEKLAKVRNVLYEEIADFVVSTDVETSKSVTLSILNILNT